MGAAARDARFLDPRSASGASFPYAGEDLELVLELARAHYLDAKQNVLLVGHIGAGKIHLAIAVDVIACRQGHRVRFTTAAGLVDELLEAQTAHRLSRYEQSLLRLHLLILDEVGFIPFTKLGTDLLFSGDQR